MSSFREFVRQLDPEDLKTLINYGAEAGIPGLIYYRETSDLYAAHHAEIWDILGDAAESFGHPNIIEAFAQNANRFNVTTHEQFANLTVWTAAEFIAASLELCRECGAPLEDAGDGYDGLCPNCADAAEAAAEAEENAADFYVRISRDA